MNEFPRWWGTLASGLSTSSSSAPVEMTPGIFRLLSARRWPSRALGFLARVQFQLSAEQRENVIRRLDIYLATTTEGQDGHDGSPRRKLRNSGASGQSRPPRDDDRNFFSVALTTRLSPRAVELWKDP